MSSKTDQLSDYEKLRLEKINRNQQRLKDLGLDKFRLPPKQKKGVAATTKKRKSTPFASDQPLRRSSRKRTTTSYNESGDDSRLDDGTSETSETDEASSSGDDDDSVALSDDDEYEEDDEGETKERAPTKKKRRVGGTGSPTLKGGSPDEDAQPAPSDPKGGLTLERAKTGRSTCRKCKDKIEKGSPRVGMQAWIVGRQAITWQCPGCFLSNLTCSYDASGRTKCKSTNTTFAKGELKVGVRSHTAQSFFKLSAIGQVLGHVAAIMPDKEKASKELLQVDCIEGNEELTPDDRSTLQSIMDNISCKDSKSDILPSTKNKRTRAKKTKTKSEGEAGNAAIRQPTLGVKIGAKGRVEWKFGGHICYGTLLPNKETKTHCFARTHKGNVKTLAKGKDYWSILP